MLRIVNNTAACVGPWLVIYRDEPPGQLGLGLGLGLYGYRVIGL